MMAFLLTFCWVTDGRKVFAAGSDDQTLRVLVLIPCRTEIEAMTGRAVSSEEEEDLAKQFSGTKNQKPQKKTSSTC